MDIWPRKIEFSEMLINSLWSLIAWIIWGMIMLGIIFIFWNTINISWNMINTWLVWNTSAIFPLIMSIITVIWTTVTIYLTYILLCITSPHIYKRNIVIWWQIWFLSCLTYLFITPIYIYVWRLDYQYIMYIYIIHTLIVIFWTSIILEVLNNYRNILLWIYWSFVWLFISSILTWIIFFLFTTWIAKLIILLVLLPIINFCITFFKQLFWLIYYYYYKYTNLDSLWEIFYRIENEENEILKKELEKNNS